MSYCWEVYQKSECETCSYLQSFKSGNYDLKKIKDIIIVDSAELPAAAPSTSMSATTPTEAN